MERLNVELVNVVETLPNKTWYDFISSDVQVICMNIDLVILQTSVQITTKEIRSIHPKIIKLDFEKVA